MVLCVWKNWLLVMLVIFFRVVLLIGFWLVEIGILNKCMLLLLLNVIVWMCMFLVCVIFVVCSGFSILVLLILLVSRISMCCFFGWLCRCLIVRLMVLLMVVLCLVRLIILLCSWLCMLVRFVVSGVRV